MFLAVSSLIGSLLLAFGSFRASSLIHHTLMRAVIRSPISFFNKTPIGNIVQRFSADITQFDNNLALYLYCMTEDIGNAFRLLLPILWLFPIWIIAVVSIFAIVNEFLVSCV